MSVVTIFGDTTADVRQRYTLWLESARCSALASGLNTLYARLSLELADHYARAARSDLQQAVLLQMAANTPPEALDTSALLPLAGFLAERDHSLADAFLVQLAGRYRGLPEPAGLLWGQAQRALHAADGRLAANLLERLGADWPAHPLRLEAFGVLARLARASGDVGEEQYQWQALLARRDSTPAHRAQALLGLGRLHAQTHDLPAAINYYQRLYTLYRAQPEPLIAAYTESAPLFEALGDLPAALATYNELLHSTDIALPAAERERAVAERDRLAAALAEPLPVASAPSAALEQAAPAALVAYPAVSGQVASGLSLTPEPTAREQAGATVSTTSVVNSSALAHGFVASPSLELRSVAGSGAVTGVSAPSDAQSLYVPETSGHDAVQWRRLLRTAAQVRLVYGGTLAGDVLGIDDGVLYLRLRQADGGVGETALPLERVAGIDFADAPLFAHANALAANAEAALAYARRKELYAVRERALRFVSGQTLQRFADLADEALQRGEPLLTLRISSRCLEALQQPGLAQSTAGAIRSQLKAQLQDAGLLGLWHLGLRGQAAASAEAILADGQLAGGGGTFAPLSALPYAVLAHAALDAGNADAALELALRPIALRGGGKQRPPDHLGTAYAVALAATARLQAEAVAGQLSKDATAEGLTPANALVAPSQ